MQVVQIGLEVRVPGTGKERQVDRVGIGITQSLKDFPLQRTVEVHRYRSVPPRPQGRAYGERENRSVRGPPA